MNNQIITAILNGAGSRSEKVRQLWTAGVTNYHEIARLTGVSYGTVWAVINRRMGVNIPLVEGIINRLFNRKFGVEIEAYGVPVAKIIEALSRAGINIRPEGYNHSTKTWWKVVSDSSIEGENSFEIVSPILEGEQGLNELKIVSEVLISLRAKINKSCGLHIHFDARSWGLQTWKNVYLNYIKYQDLINSMLPLSRRNNSYCKPLEYNRGVVSKIKGCVNINQLNEVWSGRYWVVNPKSYARHGSIEFRQHSGSIEFEKIENWIRFLDGLVKLSEKGVAVRSDFESLSSFLSEDLLNYVNLRINNFAS